MDNRKGKIEVAFDISSSSEAAEDCSWSRCKQTRMWVKVVGWMDIIFGVVCTLILVYDVYSNIRSAIVKTNSNLNFSNHIDDGKKYYTTMYIAASLLVKIIYLLSYFMKSAMGIYLLRAVEKENPTNLKRWMIVTVICQLLEFFLVTPLLVIVEKFDYVAFLWWEVPLWIITVVALLIVHRHRDELQNYSVSASSQELKQQNSILNDTKAPSKPIPSSYTSTKPTLHNFKSVV